MAKQSTRDELVRLLRLFYSNGWVSGTGGGICAMEDGALLVAPTGVHKELVAPEDFFTIDVATNEVLARPPAPLEPSECSPIFTAIVRERRAGSVIHSHALSAVLAADHSRGDALEIERLEMLKGIRGQAYPGTHTVPVISNTARERDLVDDVERALKDDRFAGSFAVLVKDHGAYLWGTDLREAKRHAEVYHFLFEATHARRGI